MSPANATLSDLSEYASALVLLSLVLVPPGFVIGWLANVLDFRRRPLSGQLGLALLLSIAIVPVSLHLLGTLLGFAALTGFLAVFWLAFPVVLWRNGREAAGTEDVAAWPLILAGGAWLVLAGFCLVDLETAEGLYRPILQYDHAKHTAVTDAILRTGLPPTNPCFRPGEDLPLYYYYFWQMLGGVAGRLGGDWVLARALAMAGVGWAGLALLSAVALAVSRLKFPLTAKTYAVAFGLLLVTGLDLIPVSLLCLQAIRGGFYEAIPPGIEGWNGCLVTAWVGLALWVPHHLAALTVAVLLWVVLDEAVQTPGRGRAWWAGILMGLGLASCVGLSVWVALVILAGLTVWGGLALLRGWWREVGILALAAGVLCLAIFPLALELRRAQLDPRFPVVFAVRHFSGLNEWCGPLLTGHFWIDCLIQALLLPLNYAAELGALLLGGILYWNWQHRNAQPVSRADAFLLVMALTSALVCGFFASALRNNDLGMRGTALLQFCLLIWTVPLLSGGLRSAGGWTSDDRLRYRVLLVLVVIGSLGSVYELVLGRTWFVGPPAAEARALRQTYEWIAAHTPRDAVVQQSWKHYPTTRSSQLYSMEGLHEQFHLLYGRRRAVVSDEMHGMLFGISRDRFEAVAEPVASLFETGANRAEVLALCRQFGITVLVVKQTDPIRSDPTAWPQQIAPVFANDFAQVYLVGDLPGDRSREPGLDRPALTIRETRGLNREPEGVK